GNSHDMLQQPDARSSLVGRVRIRKMPADIPFADRSEYRIADRMKKNIGIGVTKKTGFMGDIHPSQDQFAPRHQPVHIVTVTNSHNIIPFVSFAIFESFTPSEFR